MERDTRVGRYFLPGLVIICGVIFADQYTKWLVMALLRPGGPANIGFGVWLTTMHKISYFINEREVFGDKVLSPFLNLVMVWNQGISFGMMDGKAGYLHLELAFIALSMAVSLTMMIWLAMSTQKTVALALSLIIGGALGNVIDRVRFNAVADFLDFHLEQHHWPAFNIADSCIVLGAGILILRSLLDKDGAKEAT